MHGTSDTDENLTVYVTRVGHWRITYHPNRSLRSYLSSLIVPFQVSLSVTFSPLEPTSEVNI